MHLLSKKPALLLVILGSLLILWVAHLKSPRVKVEKDKFTIQAVSISEKQSHESIN